MLVRARDGLTRQRVTLEGAQSVRPVIDGKRVLSFCSNDYLGLANHPQVIEALRDSADNNGVGAGASHLITGHHAEHQALEQELAEFVGAERALVFSTGYMANLGVLSALADRDTTLFQDKLNHASLIDGGLLSRASFKRYPHGDLQQLKTMINERGRQRALIATDGVFSMDGDRAPLKALAVLCNENTLLLVDDAHGFGVLGQQGAGSLEHAGLRPTGSIVLMATLGKALGCFGAFVAGDRLIIDALQQFARSYIYTTATPPALAAATRAALVVHRQEDWRRQRLADRVEQFTTEAKALGLPLGESNTAIQPVILGESAAALAASQQLRDQGMLVTAIRPPTVPEGSARLRVTFCAEHTEKDVQRLLLALSQIKFHVPDNN